MTITLKFGWNTKLNIAHNFENILKFLYVVYVMWNGLSRYDIYIIIRKWQLEWYIKL
jgi:hypothetical protein